MQPPIRVIQHAPDALINVVDHDQGVPSVVDTHHCGKVAQAVAAMVDLPSLHRREVAKLDRYPVDERQRVVTHRAVAEV